MKIPKEKRHLNKLQYHRHPGEGRGPVQQIWIPAFAGMTFRKGYEKIT